MNIFQTASRLKLRFPTNKGAVSSEALWDMPIESKSNTSLDSLYTALDSEFKESQSTGLVSKPSRGNDELRLKLDIIRTIYDIRVEERKLISESKAKAEKRQQIIDALANAEVKTLEGKTPDQLRAMLEVM